MKKGFITAINEILCRYDIGSTTVPDSDEYLQEAIHIAKSIRSNHKFCRGNNFEFNAGTVYDIVSNELEDRFAHAIKSDTLEEVYNSKWIIGKENRIKSCAEEIFDFYSGRSIFHTLPEINEEEPYSEDDCGENDIVDEDDYPLNYHFSTKPWWRFW